MDRAKVMNRKLTPNQEKLLRFIQRTHAESGQAVSHAAMIAAHVLPSRHLTAARVGLIDRGLLRVVEVGRAAWLPVQAGVVHDSPL